MPRFVIENGLVITMERGEPLAFNGDVLVDGSVIRDIAPSIPLQDCERIDARDMLVLPGFVDTHRHVWQTQLRGVAADWTLLDYVVEMRFVFGALYSPDDAWLGNYAGALEALDAGVTTLVDHSHILNSPDHSDAAIRGLTDAGIRAVFCYGMYANPVRDDAGNMTASGFETPAWHFDDARRVRADRLSSADALVTMGLALNEIEAFPAETARPEIELGRELDVALMSVHVGMGAMSRGRRFVARLAEEGLLDSRLLFVHGASLDDDELTLIADAGAALSSTPETEVQMGMGLPVAWRAREAAANPSLGIDIVSNYSGDMFAQMRLALQVERGRRNSDLEARGFAPERLDLTVRDVLELATIGGARAVHLDSRIGSLAPGKQADIVLVRTDRLGMSPVNDAVAATVLYANASDVDSVFVAGHPVKRGGRLLHADVARVREQLVRSRDRILGRARYIDRTDIRSAVRGFFPVQ